MKGHVGWKAPPSPEDAGGDDLSLPSGSLSHTYPLTTTYKNSQKAWEGQRPSAQHRDRGEGSSCVEPTSLGGRQIPEYGSLGEAGSRCAGEHLMMEIRQVGQGQGACGCAIWVKTGDQVLGRQNLCFSFQKALKPSFLGEVPHHYCQG